MLRKQVMMMVRVMVVVTAAQTTPYLVHSGVCGGVVVERWRTIFETFYNLPFPFLPQCLRQFVILFDFLLFFKVFFPFLL